MNASPGNAGSRATLDAGTTALAAPRPGAAGVRLAAHVETWRPYTLGYVGLVGLSGAALAGSDPGAWRLAGAWAVPTLGWLAGLYGGDYADRELDAVARPHRPIPSGRMRPRAALNAAAGCVLAGTVLAVLLDRRALALVAAALVGGAAYGTALKHRGVLADLVRGGLIALAFLFGVGAAAAGPSAAVACAAALFWLHDAQTGLVGGLRDDGDRRAGRPAPAVRRESPAAAGWAAVLCLLWIGAAVALPALAAAPTPVLAVYVPLLMTAEALALAALLPLARHRGALPRRAALRAHEIVVLERIVLAGAVLTLGLPARVVLPLVAVALAVTSVTQHRMRDRHESGPGGRTGGPRAADPLAPDPLAPDPFATDPLVPAPAAPAAPSAVDSAVESAAAALAARQRPDGSWRDVLPSAAVPTAAAVVALHFADPARSADLIAAGARWLRDAQNPDGGWGDAPGERSTLGATPCAVGALALVDPEGSAPHVRRGLERIERFGGMDAVSDRRRCKPSALGQTYLAVAGLFPEDRVHRLPLEAALLPARMRRRASFLLPFLLSWGLMQHGTRRTGVLRRALYRPAERRVLAYLDSIERFQGPSGGYLESPLMASLVCLGLARAGVRSDIAARCAGYLRTTARPDGSWPVHRDLEVSGSASAALGLQEAGLHDADATALAAEWIRGCRRREPFPPTGCPPGGWGWSRYAGWPNTGDTAGALLVLAGQGLDSRDAGVAAGLRWLLAMQNATGSWSRFARDNPAGLDGPCPVLTAQAVTALHRAGGYTADDLETARAVRWLGRVQRPDGAVPCPWYRGLTAGTACVLDALSGLGLAGGGTARHCRDWLLAHQHADGGWGDGRGSPSSAEETAWAVLGLLGCGLPARHPAVRRGAAWLTARQEPAGTWRPAVLGVSLFDLPYSCDLLATGSALQALGRYQRAQRAARPGAGEGDQCPTSTS